MPLARITIESDLIAIFSRQVMPSDVSTSYIIFLLFSEPTSLFPPLLSPLFGGSAIWPTYLLI